MNGQIDRCDRTAYVSGLQPSITDMELFDIFNTVSHAEKVILRSGSSRHALVVFKTVEGLYTALVEFQNFILHGRQLHIRPLRESSHATNTALTSVFDFQKQSRRSSANSGRYRSSPDFWTTDKYRSGKGSSNNRRRSNNNRHYSSGFDRRSNFCDHISYTDFSSTFRRFDDLANVIRSTPANPSFDSYIDRRSNRYNNQDGKNRGSGKETPAKIAPPTWKMELQRKDEEMCKDENSELQRMTPLEFIDKVASTKAEGEKEKSKKMMQAKVQTERSMGPKKKRPNLSFINPAIFYENYPRTSSPLAYNVLSDRNNCIKSPKDPAVIAYQGRMSFDQMSPIDMSSSYAHDNYSGRHMTNDELSDMIVSTGNLKLDTYLSESDEPAPWSPVKRVRAESTASLNQMLTPQFSPIQKDLSEEDEDEVFCAAGDFSREMKSNVLKEICNINNNNINNGYSMFDDVNNSRLPSNSHSANPRSDSMRFVYPESTRYSSLSNLVFDKSSFAISGDPTITHKYDYEQNAKYSPRIFTDCE